jgi:hypothetical protein
MRKWDEGFIDGYMTVLKAYWYENQVIDIFYEQMIKSVRFEDAEKSCPDIVSYLISEGAWPERLRRE